MAFHPTTTREAAQSAGLKILVYGEAGAGKTRLCSTTPDHSKTLIISCEAGLLSLRDFDIPVAQIETIADLREVYRYLLAGDHEFDWVCLDSVSEIAEVCLAEEKASADDPRQAYGELADKMFSLLRDFIKKLPLNVYFSAKLKTTVNVTGKGKHKLETSERGPSMPGKTLTNGVAYLFDEVFAMRLMPNNDASVSRWLVTQGDGEWVAKDRSGALDPWETPSLALIAQKIKEPTTNE